MKFSRKTVLLSLAIATPVLLGGGFLFAKKVAWPRYKQYRAANFERSAREFLEKGDFDNAMLFVRKNLAANQRSVANWRLAAEISEKRNDPTVLFYLQRLVDLEPTLENRLRFLRESLRLRADLAAARAIEGAGAEARDSAEFHELAAQALLRTGNTLQAKFHLIALCELRPDSRSARLDLAQLRLAEAAPEQRGSIRAEIRTLSADPELRTRALSQLLSDSIRRDESREATELVTLLQREPDLPVAQSIAVAEALRRYQPAEFPASLARLLKLAGENPVDIARVGQFLISANLATEAKNWVATLPPATAENLIVQRLRAAILAELAEWQNLEDTLKTADWKDYDFERLALVALAQHRLGNLPAFGETWRLALTNAGTNATKLEALHQRTIRWNWRDQRIEVLWRLFQQTPSNTVLQQQLFAHERAQGHTANLNRLFARMLEASPSDASAKNNFAYTSLLLASGAARATTLAREAHKSDPRNANYATTYAFAQLRAGRADEALATLATLDSLQLWQPERLVIQAAALVAAQRTAEAEPLLANFDDRGLLPEERTLFNETRTAVERHRRETARTAEIVETVAAHRDASAKSFFPLLPESVRTAPSLPMELADSLYGRDDFTGLAKELGGTPWENRDFLRLALLAYAQRRLDRLSDSRANWRLAVSTAGTRTDLQRTLAALAGAWNWDEERMDLLARVLQREPSDLAVFDEVAAYYLKLRRTADLARVYGAAVTGGIATSTQRAQFAYYSLLVGNNTSEAHVAAKAAFDQNPADLTAARALALSLWKQGQGRAGLQILGNLATRLSPEIDLSLVLALLHEAAGEIDSARQQLAAFSAASALPEEAALAKDLQARLATAK